MSEIRDSVKKQIDKSISSAYWLGKNCIGFPPESKERIINEILSIPLLAIVEGNELNKEKDTTVILRYRCNTCGILYKKWVDAELCCGHGGKEEKEVEDDRTQKDK